jgi:uncharacterized protein YwgA
MNAYDFVHLALLAIDEEVRGSTKLQKTIYFLGVLTGSLDQLGYRPHYYGPYSDSVAAAVNRLKALGFVQQSSLHTGAVNEEGFEITRKDYSLTDQGRTIARQKATQNPSVWKKVEQAVSRFKTAGEIDYMKMSVAAKTYFILSGEGKPATAIELSESAKGLGWNPKPEEISDSISFLKSLGLLRAEARAA